MAAGGHCLASIQLWPEGFPRPHIGKQPLDLKIIIIIKQYFSYVFLNTRFQDLQNSIYFFILTFMINLNLISSEAAL